MKINRICPQDSNFLQITSYIAKPPTILYFIGKIPENRCKTVAIVGSRKPTRYGQEITYQIAFELAQKNIVIVSGLALGTDAIAHKATLDAGGTTIAVLANGLNEIRPMTNYSLGKKIIASGGALVSEYEPNEPAMAYRFLERNRLISAISDAVVVTEAARRSGALSTATHAIEQGKDVFALPGNITSPMSVGCNRLIQQGATPLLSAEDVLAVIAPDLPNEQTPLPLGDNKFETKIITLMRDGIRDGDELQVKSEMEISEFSMAMTNLELNGYIRPLGANQWMLK